MPVYGLSYVPEEEKGLSQGTKLAKHPSHFVSTGANGLNGLWWSFHHLCGHLSFTYNFTTSTYYTLNYSVIQYIVALHSCPIISIIQIASGSLSLGFSCPKSCSSNIEAVGIYQNLWHIADPLLGLVSCVMAHYVG